MNSDPEVVDLRRYRSLRPKLAFGDFAEIERRALMAYGVTLVAGSTEHEDAWRDALESLYDEPIYGCAA